MDRGTCRRIIRAMLDEFIDLRLEEIATDGIQCASCGSKLAAQYTGDTIIVTPCPCEVKCN